MTKTERHSETSAKFCHSVRRHTSEDGSRRSSLCCGKHDSQEVLLLVRLLLLNAQSSALGRDLFSTSGRVRLRNPIDRATLALVPFRNGIKQHVRTTTANKLQKNCTAQIALRLRLSRGNASLHFQGSPSGFRGGLSGSRTVNFDTDSISCYHYVPRHVSRPFVYYPYYWHQFCLCLISTHIKNSTASAFSRKTIASVVQEFQKYSINFIFFSHFFWTCPVR